MDIGLELIVLSLLFFFVSMSYASVGLGGGSSYTALMAIFGLNAMTIPMVSLMLNVIVSSVGSVNFIRKDHARFRIIIPFLVSSMPMAWVGGSLNISPILFYWLLWLSLMVVALRIFLFKQISLRLDFNASQRLVLSLLSGGLIGLISGIVGIGGGIFLVPMIIILGLGSEKEAAACGAIFIWLNSTTGLISRLRYNSIDLIDYIPLIIAVLLGGALGSFLGANTLNPRVLQRILGLIIVVAILILGRKILVYS